MVQARGHDPADPGSVETEENRWRVRDVAPVALGSRAVTVATASAAGYVAAQLALGYPPRMATALFLCLLGGLVVLLEPFVGVVGYVVLAFLRPQDVFWGLGQERFTLIVSLATLGATLVHFTRRPRLEFLAFPQVLGVALLYFTLYLSTEFGRFGEPDPIGLSRYGKIFLIYLVVIAVVNSMRKLVIVACVLSLSLGYLSYWANEKYFIEGWWVVNGPGAPGYTFYDSNDFAMVLGMNIPFLWFLHRSVRNRLLRWVFLGIVPLAVHSVMVTYSRGGFLGMVACVLFTAFRERNRRLGALIIGCGVAFWFLFTGDAYRARIMSIGHSEEDTSVQARHDSWATGRIMIKDNPVFGVGLGQYLRAYSYYSTKKPYVAHNSWIQLAAECGFPTLACWAGLILLSWVSIVRVWLRAPRLPPGERLRAIALSNAFGGALTAYLVCGLFLSSEDLEFFYVLVGLVQVLDRLTGEMVRGAGTADLRPATA